MENNENKNEAVVVETRKERKPRVNGKQIVNNVLWFIGGGAVTIGLAMLLGRDPSDPE